MKKGETYLKNLAIMEILNIIGEVKSLSEQERQQLIIKLNRWLGTMR